MEQDNKLSKGVKYALYFFCGMGAVLVYISTRKYGIGLSPDSVNYLAAARSLAAGQGWLDFSGEYFTLWPPLYPVIMAFFILINLEPLEAMVVLNIMIFAATIYISTKLFSRVIKSKALLILGIFAISTAPVLLENYKMAWTEPLFILLVLLFINFLIKYIKEKNWKYLLVMAIVSALVCIQRYIGVAVVLTGLFFIIFPLIKQGQKQIIKHGFVYLAIALAPLLIWLGRNYYLTSSLAGTRMDSPFGLLINIGTYLDAVSSWLVVGWSAFSPFKVLIFLSLVLVLILATILLRSRYKNIAPNRQSIKPLVIYTIFYTLVVFILTIQGTWQYVDGRYLSPIYVLMLCFFLVGVENLLLLIKSKKIKPRLQYLVICFVALLFMFSFIKSVSLVNTWYMYGAGWYRDKNWQESSFIKSLKNYDFDGNIYSNDPRGAYFLLDQYAFFSPRVDADFSLPENQAKPNYLIWFDITNQPYVHNFDYVDANYNLQEVFRGPYYDNEITGIVYKFW